jgi:hypothetical protein
MNPLNIGSRAASPGVKLLPALGAVKALCSRALLAETPAEEREATSQGSVHLRHRLERGENFWRGRCHSREVSP